MTSPLKTALSRDFSSGERHSFGSAQPSTEATSHDRGYVGTDGNVEEMKRKVEIPEADGRGESNQRHNDIVRDDIPGRGDFLARRNEVKTLTEKLVDGLTQGGDFSGAGGGRASSTPDGAVPRDSFFYLRRVDSNPYNLEMTSHSKINPKDYYTVSRLGITHFAPDGVEFQPLQKFERENYIYSLLVKLRDACLDLQEARLFGFEHPTGSGEPVGWDADYTNVQQQQKTYTLAEFLQRLKAQKTRVERLVDHFISDAEMTAKHACENYLYSFLQNTGFNDVKPGGTNRPRSSVVAAQRKESIIFRGDKSQQKPMTYTERATMKTQCRRVTKFLRVVEFLISDAMLRMAISSTVHLRNALATYIRELDGEDNSEDECPRCEEIKRSATFSMIPRSTIQPLLRVEVVLQGATAPLSSKTNASDRHQETRPSTISGESQDVDFVADSAPSGLLLLDRVKLNGYLKPSPRKCLDGLYKLIPTVLHLLNENLTNEYTVANDGISTIPTTVEAFSGSLALWRELQTGQEDMEEKYNGVRSLYHLLEEYRVKMTDTDQMNAFVLTQKRSQLKASIELFESNCDQYVAKFGVELEARLPSLVSNLTTVTNALSNPILFDLKSDINDTIVYLTQIEDDVLQLEAAVKQHFDYEKTLGLPMTTAFDEMDELKADLALKIDLWKAFRGWKFDVKPYKRSKDYYILDSLEGVYTMLEESLVNMTAVLNSKFIAPIKDTAVMWHKRLLMFQETFDAWIECQRKWMHLETIFSAPDIQKQLPNEGATFIGVNQFWKDLMRKTRDQRSCLKVTGAILIGASSGSKSYKDGISSSSGGGSGGVGLALLDNLTKHNSSLERIEKSLEDYLEMKRRSFPRFYFISNDELLEMLAHAKEPQIVQRHLPKCFDALAKLDISDDTAHGSTTVSSSQDIVAMISPEGERVLFGRIIKARGNIEDWLNAVLVNMKVTLHKHVKNCLADYQHSSRETWLFRHPAQAVAVVSYIIWAKECELCFHSRSKDPVQELSLWHQTICTQLGNLTRLVRTNLTSVQRRVVVSLVTTDVHFRDIVESLVAKSVTDANDFLWQQQLRYKWYADRDECDIYQANCRIKYGYEYMGACSRLVITPLTDRCWMTITGAWSCVMGRPPLQPNELLNDGEHFQWCDSSRAWVCLDEFNRIDIEVLSVVGQQMSVLRNARLMSLTEVLLDGKCVPLRDHHVIITMNPGYVGRTELPDNLKVSFRPVAMMVPDYALIAEILLFAEGFLLAKPLSRKVTKLYKLCSEQLSQQAHYDFGMRAVRTVLTMTGSLKRSSRIIAASGSSSLNVTATDSAATSLNDENVILIKAMVGANTPKLTDDDNRLFQGIVRDLFPDTLSSLGAVECNALIEGVGQLRLAGLQGPRQWTKKLLQLFATLEVRVGVIQTGSIGSGKSTALKVLNAAVSALRERIAHPDARFQRVVPFTLNPKSVSMIELYGFFHPITHEWTDGLASKLLRTYVPITSFNPREPHPPTPLSTKAKTRVLKYFDLFVEPGLAFIHSVSSSSNASRQVPISTCDLGFVATICHIFQALLIHRAPPELFAIARTPRSNLADASSPESLLSLEDQRNRCLDLMFIFSFAGLSAPSCSNDDVLKYRYLVELMAINARQPILLTGATGSGKSAIVHNILDHHARIAADIDTSDLDTDSPLSVIAHGKILPHILNLSAQTSSAGAQLTIESKFSKKRRTLLGAPVNKQLVVIFVDDVNMPTTEKNGAQPVIELLRQYLEYGGLYDRERFFWKDINDSVLIAAVGCQEEVVKPFAHDLYGIQGLLPTPSKCHYTFNLRDVTKLMQGIVLGTGVSGTSVASSKKGGAQPTCSLAANTVVNLWAHEGIRVFRDRLMDSTDRRWFSEKLVEVANRVFGVSWTVDAIGIDSATARRRAQSTVDSGNPPKQEHSTLLFSPRRVDKTGNYAVNSMKYDQVGDLNRFKMFLNGQIQEYNCSPTVQESRRAPLDLVLFEDAMIHIAAIARILIQPRGHALLLGMGGCGKRSLARLAVFLTGYYCFEIELRKGYGLEEFREDLKPMMKLAVLGDTGEGPSTRQGSSINAVPTVFLLDDSQLTSDFFLEDINTILNGGGIPKLFTTEEMERIISDVRVLLERSISDAKSLNGGQYQGGIKSEVGEFTRKDSEDYFHMMVRNSLHFVICMNPLGEAFRARVRQFPALINCTTIDYFDEWPKSALEYVAEFYLSQEDPQAQPRSGPGMSRRPSTRDFANSSTIRSAVTTLCVEAHLSVSAALPAFLIKCRRRVYITSQHYLDLISLFRRIHREKQAQWETKLQRLTAGVVKLEETNSLVSTLQEELVVLQPVLVSKTQEAEELLHQVAIDQTEAEQVAQRVRADEAVVKQQQREVSACQVDAQSDLDQALPALNAAVAALDSLDKKDISEVKGFVKPPQAVQVVMEALCIMLGEKADWDNSKRILSRSTFMAELKDGGSQEVSHAAMSLCMWVHAIDTYARVVKEVAPKRQRLAEMNAVLEVANMKLESKQQELAKVLDKVRKLKEACDATLKEKQRLLDESVLTQLRLQNAEKLTEGLSDERVRWKNSITLLKQEGSSILGDSFLVAASLSYLGPFDGSFDANFSLSDTRELREWQLLGLPSDSFSTDNALFALKSKQRWTLMIDPQQQATQWIKRLEAANHLETVKADDPNLMQVVEDCLVGGNPVLIEDVTEALNPSLEPVVAIKPSQRPADSKRTTRKLFVKLDDRLVETDAERFRLYLTTKLANPHFVPDVYIRVNVINFTVTSDGLEEQLLSDVVQRERMEVEERKHTLLANAKGNILDDVELIRTLETSKQTSNVVAQRLSESEATKQEVLEIRNQYQGVAVRGAMLFFVIADLADIDPMYQFSLEYFDRLFIKSLNEAPVKRNLSERLVGLQHHITLAVYRNICRGLFKAHKQLFALVVCLKIMISAGELNQCDVVLLDRLVVDIDMPTSTEAESTNLNDSSSLNPPNAMSSGSQAQC
ncbi:P-loop containing nucleoside triphosphate hydrolase [Phytophthora cactorum]|nr:P-loop containing nucleoside triphosphate hydrolase [Phytophthora cactorum]